MALVGNSAGSGETLVNGSEPSHGNKKSPARGGAKGSRWLGRINRRKGGERRWWWSEPGRTEREQERRIEPAELVGPGAAVSAVRFPAAASSGRARLLAMRSCRVGLGAAGC